MFIVNVVDTFFWHGFQAWPWNENENEPDKLRKKIAGENVNFPYEGAAQQKSIQKMRNVHIATYPVKSRENQNEKQLALRGRRFALESLFAPDGFTPYTSHL